MSSPILLHGSTLSFYKIKHAFIHFVGFLPLGIRAPGCLGRRGQRSSSRSRVVVLFLQGSLRRPLQEGASAAVCARRAPGAPALGFRVRGQSPRKMQEHTGPGLLEKKVTCWKSSGRLRSQGQQGRGTEDDSRDMPGL